MVLNEFKKRLDDEIKQYEELIIIDPKEHTALTSDESFVVLNFNWRLTKKQVATLLHSINDCILNVYEIEDKFVKGEF